MALLSEESSSRLAAFTSALAAASAASWVLQSDAHFFWPLALLALALALAIAASALVDGSANPPKGWERLGPS